MLKINWYLIYEIVLTLVMSLHLSILCGIVADAGVAVRL
jgi:hypothetical protein